VGPEGPSGDAFITDCGLARRLAQALWQTDDGQILGPPAYMAPEQASRREIGPETDVYALGVMLYQLLTGHLPLEGKSPAETIFLLTSQDPPPPRRRVPNLSRDLETVCLKCLEKEPHKRYKSAEALADDLRRFLQGDPVHARPCGPLERGLRWARRSPVLAGMMAAVALLLVAFVAVLSGATVRLQREQAQLRESEARRKKAMVE